MFQQIHLHITAVMANLSDIFQNLYLYLHIKIVMFRQQQDLMDLNSTTMFPNHHTQIKVVVFLKQEELSRIAVTPMFHVQPEEKVNNKEELMANDHESINARKHASKDHSSILVGQVVRWLTSCSQATH